MQVKIKKTDLDVILEMVRNPKDHAGAFFCVGLSGVFAGMAFAIELIIK